MPKHTELLRVRVKSRLTELRISQNELGRRMGVSSAEISDWLSGKTAVRYERVCEMAEALETQPWELLKPQTTPQPQVSGPKLVTSPPTSLLGEAVRILAGLDEHELRTALVNIEAAPELAATTRLSQNKKLSQDGS